MVPDVRASAVILRPVPVVRDVEAISTRTSLVIVLLVIVKADALSASVMAREPSDITATVFALIVYL